MLPYHCDALFPTAARYASPRFRRVAQWVDYRVLDYADAVELIAFVETVGLKYARWILHWERPAVVRTYGYLKKRLAGDDVDAAILANQLAFGPDVGLAVLQAMQDGGWKRGKMPWVTKMALKEARKYQTIAEIARATGLTREQVKTACDVRRAAANRGFGPIFVGN